MALTGILAEITQARVKGHLLERDPAVITSTEPGDVAAFETLVRSAAAQVTVLTGDNPPVGRVRNLAVEAIAVQTAAEIEYATFPEQQAAGLDGRGYHLHQRYLELLNELRRIMDAHGGIVPEGDGPLLGATAGRPRSRFPKPLGWPC